MKIETGKEHVAHEKISTRSMLANVMRIFHLGTHPVSTIPPEVEKEDAVWVDEAPIEVQIETK